MAPSIILWEGWQWPANMTRGKMVWQTSWPADPWQHFRRLNPRAGHVQGVGPFQRQKGLREGVEIRSAGQQWRSQCLCPGGDGKRRPVRAGTLPCQRDGAQRLGARILSCGMRLRPFTLCSHGGLDYGVSELPSQPGLVWQWICGIDSFCGVPAGSHFLDGAKKYPSYLRFIDDFSFPAPILLAICLDNIPSQGFKRAVQTISYLPHFISWVVMAGLVYRILDTDTGIVNYIIRSLIELVIRVTAHTGISTNPDFLLLWFYGMKKAQRDKSTFAPGLYSKTPQKGSAA